MNQSKNSTPKIAIPKTADGCSVAVTASFSMISNIRYSLRRKKYGRKMIIKPNEVLIVKRVS